MLSKLAETIKSNYLAIILAFICGMIYVSPHILFIVKTPGYSGIQFTPHDSELHYMARVREVSEGHYRYANTFLAEYKEVDTPVLMYAEVIYGEILKISHLSVENFYLAAKFIFPIITFLLWYYFVFLLTRNKPMSLFGSLFLVLGFHLKSFLNPLGQIDLFLGKSTVLPLITYGRFLNPLTTFLFFFIALILLFRFFQAPNLKKSIYFGIALGVLFYPYFYFWAYICVLLGVIFIYYLIKKSWTNLKLLFASIFVSLIIGFYYLRDIIRIAFGNSLENTSGGALSVYEPTHEVILSKTVLAGLFLILCLIAYKKYKKTKISQEDIFILLLVVSSILVINQQTITGRLVEEGHFHWYVNWPIVMLVIVYVFNFILQKVNSNKFSRLVIGIGVIYLLAFGAANQASGYKKLSLKFEHLQSYGQTINWLEKNIKPEDVVLANNELSALIPAYTSANVYSALRAKNYGSTPLGRRLHSAYVYEYLDNSGEIDSVENEAYIRNYVYFQYSRQGKTTYPEYLDQEFDKLAQKYEKMDFYIVLKQYKLDYIIWNKEKDPNWQLDRFEFLDLKFEENGILIYKVK